MAYTFGSDTLDTESITITSDMGVSYLSINATSGTVTLLCEGKTLPGRSNQAQVIPLGNPVQLSSTQIGQFVDGVTIDATSGVAELIFA